MTARPSRPSNLRHAARPPRVVLVAALAATLLTTACGGDDPAASADSSLARDLALANQVAAQPALQDMPLGEMPEPEQRVPDAPPRPVQAPARTAAPMPGSPVAARRPAAQPTPRREMPAPTPARDSERQAEREPEPAAAPAAAPSRAPGFSAGTRLALTTSARVCTVSGRPGDKLTATLQEAVRGEGGAVIPAGATVVLEVASVEPGEPAEAGRITFRVRSLDIDERAHPARGSGSVSGGLQRAPVSGVNASDRKRVITGAVLGAIAGRVLDGGARGAVIGAAAGGAVSAANAKRDQQFEGCLPAGTPVTIALDEAVTLG